MGGTGPTNAITLPSGRIPLSVIAGPNPPIPVDLGQSETALQVVNWLREDASAKVALEGPYGSGKSRLLNLIREQIPSLETADAKVIVVNYDPWKYGPDPTTLRRTFLTAFEDAMLAREVLKNPVLDRVRFHTAVGSTRPLSGAEIDQEIEAEFRHWWKSLRLPSRVAFWLTVIGLLAYAAANLAELWLGVDLAPLAAGALLAAISGVAMFMSTTLHGAFSIRVPRAKDILEPRIHAIDQFEEYYGVFRLILAGNHNLRASTIRYRAVVLIDDLDRCSDSEIKAVLGGLGTYLSEQGPKGSAPISFVVALDTERAERILSRSDGETPAQKRTAVRRHNELGKHFHRFIPVPQPSLSQLREIIEATARAESWPISRPHVEEIGRLAALYLHFNLRATIHSVTDANQVRLHGAGTLNAKSDPNLEAILRNPTLLFRIALLRNLSSETGLREIVSNLSFWTGRRKLPASLGVEESILAMEPPFKPGVLDPLPLLQLGSAQGAIFDPGEMPGVLGRLHSAKAAELKAEFESIQDPAARIYVATYALAALRPAAGNGLSDDQKGRLVSAAISFLDGARTTVHADHLFVFADLLRVIEHDPIRAHVPQDFDSWLRVAAAMGAEAFTMLFAKPSPFYKDQGWKNKLFAQASTQLRNLDASFGTIFADALLRRVNAGDHAGAATWISSVLQHPDVDKILGLGHVLAGIFAKIDLRQPLSPHLLGPAAKSAVAREVKPDDIAKLRGHFESTSLPPDTREALGKNGWTALWAQP